jgi:adenine-specific DNA-methyltransferase
MRLVYRVRRTTPVSGRYRTPLVAAAHRVSNESDDSQNGNVGTNRENGLVANLEHLVSEIGDKTLRTEVEREVAALKQRVKFGLVYERHIPETVVVGDIDPLQVGDHVRPRVSVDVDEDFRVTTISSRTATLVSLVTGDERRVSRSELIAIKRFGDPAYVGLEALGGVRRSAERPSHAVINGENFHTLQLLAFTHERQVDCIYIDPPYNTGARDWTYNNDYVDTNDSYGHSKWLSFMEKRLKIARRLLKPDGVLIVTIDDTELCHLGLLLEELFPDARRQLVTICINPGGAAGEGLSRVEEYAFFCFLGGSEPAPTEDDMLVDPSRDGTETSVHGVRWERLMRGGNAWYRASRPNLCYPVVLSDDRSMIVRAGDPLDGPEEKRAEEIDGHPVAWPVRQDGKLGIWRVEPARLNWLVEQGYAMVTERNGSLTLKYLLSGTVEAIDSGIIEVIARGDRGQVLVQASERSRRAKTIWYRGRHTAGGSGGTYLLNALLGERNLFPFPKSVYAVRDTLEIAVGDRPEAVVLDFFAGSGTTLNATCLLNAEDGGTRRSILVTNNEVNPERKRKLNQDGLYRGQPEYERHGIFEAVTRPRCAAAITGKRADGATIEGRYLSGRPYAEGFEENVEFFRLDYLDGDEVELGQGFESVHPLLWLASGARGKRPKVGKTAKYLVAEECGYAVLFDDGAFREFEDALASTGAITHVFLVTDSDDGNAEMRLHLAPELKTTQLYRDFVRHFRRMTRR